MQKKKVVKREITQKQVHHRQRLRLKVDNESKDSNVAVIGNIEDNVIEENDGYSTLETAKPTKKNRKIIQIENNELNEENNE